ALLAAFALAALPAAARAQALSLGLALPISRLTPGLVVVPDVRGQSLSGAAVRVAGVGLVPRHAASAPGDVDTSPVRRQWPRAGQRVPQGTVVALELAAVPAGAPARAPAHGAAAAAVARLARTSVTASFDTRERPRPAPSAALWWAAAGVGATLLFLGFRQKPAAREPITAAEHPVDGDEPMRADAAPHAADGPRRRFVRAVRVKRTRSVPRYALAAAGPTAAHSGLAADA
ncbi:MAG TPA: PASTA domain-containing protein, partial [Longimicrobium sp.]|nr:PASTA domain-containing protein [Longimicrobium sp.]